MTTYHVSPEGQVYSLPTRGSAPVEADTLTTKTGDLADQTNYVLHYGGNCRDCADENGVCPSSGLPCGGARKAVEYVLGALNYGVTNGFVNAPVWGAR